MCARKYGRRVKGASKENMCLMAGRNQNGWVMGVDELARGVRVFLNSAIILHRAGRGRGRGGTSHRCALIWSFG